MCIRSTFNYREVKHHECLLSSGSGHSARDTKEDGTANGFDSIWRRFINKALRETKLEDRFTEHDLRAKVASDIELEHAKLLLGHTNTDITNKVYRRKTQKVKPISQSKL